MISYHWTTAMYTNLKLPFNNMNWKRWIFVAVVAFGVKKLLDCYLKPDQSNTVQGYVDPDFKLVADEFRKNVESGYEPGAALAVYHKGKLVVDLWGGSADVIAQRPWSRDTMTMVFSVSKGLAAIVVATLVQKGHLDYKSPVAKYWPEFAQNDKGNITVEMLISHQAGLVVLDTNFEILDLLHNRDKVEKVLAAQPTNWPAGSKLGYHAVTYGMYVDTLVRKADPEHRTLGQILQDEIASVYGIDVYMNLPKDLFHRAARIHNPPQWDVLLHCIFVSPKYFPIIGYMILYPDSLLGKCGKAVKEFTGDLSVFNNPELREVELASAMGTATARGVAKLYSILSMGGVDIEINKRLLTPELVKTLETPVVTGDDVVLKQKNNFGPGTVIKNSPEGELTMFGHTGHGGQVGMADSNHELGIGYITNFISIYGMGDDPRYVCLEKAIYESVRRLKENQI